MTVCAFHYENLPSKAIYKTKSAVKQNDFFSLQKKEEKKIFLIYLLKTSIVIIRQF